MIQLQSIKNASGISLSLHYFQQHRAVSKLSSPTQEEEPLFNSPLPHSHTHSVLNFMIISEREERKPNTFYFHPCIINSADIFCSKTHTDSLTWSPVVDSITTASGARLGGGRGAWGNLNKQKKVKYDGAFITASSITNWGAVKGK